MDVSLSWMSGNQLRLNDGLRSRFLGQHPGYFRIAGQAGITTANAISRLDQVAASVPLRQTFSGAVEGTDG